VKRTSEAGNITSENHRVCMMTSDREHIRHCTSLAFQLEREVYAAEAAEVTRAEGAVARATCKN